MNTWTMPASSSTPTRRGGPPPVPASLLTERTGPLAGDRFEIRGLLGTGAFGDVFRVFDRRLETVVALKSLHRMGPAALYHFKKEFRSLADVHHTNLVELYELQSVEDQWFFTMELIEGFNFLEYAGLSSFWSGLDTSELPVAAIPSSAPQVRRLRSSLEQLVRGLEALHRSGNLHCDVKPSNIRVHREGRLVVLDFGLVREIPRAHALQTHSGEVMGTPAYMSPEQARGGPMTEASDWYAVGGILYEALVGRRPFSGTAVEVLKVKQYLEPPAPRDVYPEIPSDLSDLCRRLLSCDPASRPSGDEILDVLVGDRAAETVVGFASSARQESTPFVGREKELAQLSRRLDATRNGRAVAVFLHGSSGLGKSALADRFLALLYRRRPGVVVLRGRCYERESVPYKGLDPLIDALSRYLKSLPDAEVETLVPANVGALTRLFPVLERVPAVARACRNSLAIAGERGLRREACSAMREILTRLGKRWPVILYVDDLQWSDRDSCELLEELLSPPDPPAMLLVCCFRRGPDGGVPLLYDRLVREPRDPICEVCEIEVGRLSFAEVCELGRLLFGDRSRTPQAVVGTLAREADGNPFFMAELVRYARSESEDGLDASAVSWGLGIRLENLIWSRIEKLPPAARRLLDAVAVAGQPLAVEAAFRAAEAGEDGQAIATRLRAGGLMRLHGSRRRTLELSHDRIRETAIQGLDPAGLAEIHRRLAMALEATGDGDVATLAAHYHAAGDRPRAAELAAAAARRASEALALDRAARLYQLAIDLQDEGAEARRLRIDLGDVLAKNGRSPEAARVYLAAAAAATGTEELELRRRAIAQQFLSGDPRAPGEMLQLLRSAGARVSRTKAGAVLSLARLRSRLKLRGLRFRERAEEDVPDVELCRLDICWSCVGMPAFPPRWMELGSRHLLLSLAAGEPERVIRALHPEVFVSAMRGFRHRRRTASLVNRARMLAKRVGHPHAFGLAELAAGIAAFFEGRWKRAAEHFERGKAHLRDGMVDRDLNWTAHYCHMLTCTIPVNLEMQSLWWGGRVGQLLRSFPLKLAEATDRGNAAAEIMLRSCAGWLARLAADQADEAEEELREVAGKTPASQNSLIFEQRCGQAELALYRGDAAAALRIFEDGWTQLRDTGLLRIQVHGIQARHARGRAALAVLAAGGGDPQLARRLRQDIRKVEHRRLGWSGPLAQLLKAGLATVEERHGEALEGLEVAEVAFESADMELYAAVSRRRRGQLLAARAVGLSGGRGRPLPLRERVGVRDTGTGEDLVAAADRWMSEQGIRNPERMADALAPGRWPPV